MMLIRRTRKYESYGSRGDGVPAEEGSAYVSATNRVTESIRTHHTDTPLFTDTHTTIQTHTSSHTPSHTPSHTITHTFVDQITD